MTPERVGYDMARAEMFDLGLGLPWYENDQAILQKCCADLGDRDGLAFWVAVRTQYLLFQTHYDLTGELPGIERDDPVQYLGMMFWDDGWISPHCALWSARAHKHPDATTFFEQVIHALDTERVRIGC